MRISLWHHFWQKWDHETSKKKDKHSYLWMLLTDHPSCIKEMKDNQTHDAFIQMQCKYKRCKFEGALTTVPCRQTTACLALIHSPQFSPSIWTSIFSQNIKLWFLQCTLHTMKHKERCARSGVYFWAPTGYTSRTDAPSHCPHRAKALVSQHVGVWKVTLS